VGESQPILVFFDGVCHLCQGTVKFILKRDRNRLFAFAPLQGETAKAYLNMAVDETAAPESVIVWHQGKKLERSAAIFHILRYLPGPWKLLSVFRFLPSFVSDPLYRFVARNRYRWFGRAESCMMPKPEWKEQFLP
jgi:predicted DCC family thiol-disulfide oxidoreductase YuxK